MLMVNPEVDTKSHNLVFWYKPIWILHIGNQLQCGNSLGASVSGLVSTWKLTMYSVSVPVST